MCLKSFKILLITIFFILFCNSCLVDVVDHDVKKINVKTISEILEKVDVSNYAKLKDTTEFPIMAWRGVPDGHITLERFKEAKDAGININFFPYSHVDSALKALDIAQQVGIKLLVSAPGLGTTPATVVPKFKNHPANAGYFLVDEPIITSISHFKNVAKKIEAIDNSRFCYINLLPLYSTPEQLGNIDYLTYIQRYINEIPLKILSFDHYPVTPNMTIRFDWYKNLEIIKSETEKAKIPFWGFALTSAVRDFPVTDINQLRLQVYSNLSYGAKGLQYFTYWTPSTLNFRMGPIENDGTQTTTYNYIKMISKEIQNLSYIFLSSKVNRVMHYGEVPEGASIFSSIPSHIKSLKIRGGNALISELENSNNKFLMIQNNNLNAEIGVSIEADSVTKMVLKDATIIPFSLINEEFRLIPGDVAILVH